jgi:quercetin dioxygenase-like cupin family protein
MKHLIEARTEASMEPNMITPNALKERFIPFASLRYSTDAFIDYCIPACKPKFNYALIGSGVSQNPNQPVSLRERHGFQLGGVSMPRGKVNPPHMHFTCEVFICTRGDWRLQWGFNPEPSHADVGEGDIASMPTWMYRGFTNVGVDDGFLFTVLGGDSTGGILWGPDTLAAARAQGVQLTSEYQIIDSTRGDVMPPGAHPLEPMTADDIAALHVWTPQAMAQRIVRFTDLRWSKHALLDAQLPSGGAQLAPVIGMGVTQDRRAQAPVSNDHGVSIEWLRLPPGASVGLHRLQEKQVLLAKAGCVEVSVHTTDGPRAYTTVGTEHAWDTFCLPPDCWRSLHNPGPGDALALLVTSGGHRKRIEWDAAVVAAASQHDTAVDADGFLAPRRFVERAQR